MWSVHFSHLHRIAGVAPFPYRADAFAHQKDQIQWKRSVTYTFSPLPEARIPHKVGAIFPAYPLPGATSATERCAGIALGPEKCGIAREKTGQL